MKTKIDKILTRIENSCDSSGVAFADHLRTVAQNGPEYATTEALREEAESIMGWARLFLEETTNEP